MFSAIRARLRLSSVPARLTFWYLLTLGGSLLGFAVFVYVVRSRTIYRELDADLEVRAHQLEVRLWPALLSLDPSSELAANAWAADEPFLVREAPEQLVFRSPAFPVLDWASERRIGAAARNAEPFVTAIDRSGVPVRVATVVVARPGAEAMALQVAESTARAEQTMRQLGSVMGLAIVIVLGIASVGSTFTARRALAPVDEIVRRARHIQAHRLSERLDIQAGSDELDRLVRTLNDMLDRIEVSFRAARRFAGDASHELQTPIAVMRTAIDVFLKNPHQATDFREVAEDLLAELERLSAVVRDLRLLALADAGYLVVNAESVDLTGVVTECSEIGRALGEEKQIRVDTRVAHRPIVKGSALHLRRAVLNLVENAVRYSPVASAVVVSIAQADRQAVVTVQDHGCGIAAADLPHIFEPFYRADPARARETGGTGLGLAIVDQVVRAHGGRIEVTSEPGSGSTFTVHLPTA